MADSEHSSSESGSGDEQLTKINLKFLNIFKKKKIKTVDEKKIKINDALASGAEIDFQDLYNFKRTALYYAVKNGEKEIVDHLLFRGAKVITKDIKANPLECAEKLKQTFSQGSAGEQNYTEIIDVLKNKISRNDSQPSTSNPQTLNTSAPAITNRDTESKRNLSDSEEEVSSKKSKNELPKESVTYEASGLKSTLHGVVYQLKLLMLYAKRCQKENYKFRLATEMVAAEKFDDVVLKFTNPVDNITRYIFLQAKHIQKENEDARKIKASDLQTKKDENFSLMKYFKSYQKIKKSDKFEKQSLKYFIINTNIDFEFDDETNPLNTQLKKLNTLYFEPFNTENDLFNVQSDDDDKVSKFYKLVGIGHIDERKEVVSELTTLFNETTDFQNLAKALAEALINEKPIDLVNSLFKEYHASLINEVIDSKSEKLRQNFITLNSSLSSEARDFRAVLLKYVEETLNAKPQEEQSTLDKEILEILEKNIKPPQKKQKLTDNDLQLFWNEVGKIILKISDGFKKRPILEKNPILKDPETYADGIVHLINQMINKNNKNSKINSNSPILQKIEISKTNSLIDEIFKLAGHILVKGAKTDIIFKNTFFDRNSKLAGNLEVFRKELEKKLQNISINFDKLKDYTFKIKNFVTCKENEVDELLANNLDFPSLEVTEEETEGFINDLMFAVNQPSEDKLCKIINEELGEEFNLINSEFVTHDFAKRMLDWFKEKDGTYFESEHIDSFFINIKEKISQIALIGPTSIHINKLKKTEMIFKLNELNNTFVDKNNDVTIKTLLNFLNQSKDKPPIISQFCHLDTAKTSPLLGSIKVIQILKEETKEADSQAMKQIKMYYSREDSFISLDLNTLLLISDRVLSVFKKKEGTPLLIVECNSNEKLNTKLNKLKHRLNDFNQKRLLLIGPTDNVFIEKFYNDDSKTPLKIVDESVFNDLVEVSQEHLLKRTCMFQKYEIMLNQLFDKNHTNVTDSIILANILDNEKTFEIGNPIPNLVGYDKKYFIERIFWQEFEKNPQKTVGMPDTNCSLEQKSEKDQNNPHKFVTIPKISNLKKRFFLQDLEKHPHKSVKTKKTLKDLLKQLKENTQKKIMIISDVAGMGKSTVLTHLSQEIKKQSQDHWIVQIELSKHTDAFKALTSSKAFTTYSAINFISDNILEIKTPFEAELLKHLFEIKKVVLLLDAFDEISPSYETKVLELLEALKSTDNQVLVTTRPHLKESLAKNQKDRVVFCNLEPFSVNDQITFLTKFWSEKLKLDDKKTEVQLKVKRIIKFAIKLLHKLTRSIRDNEFTGIPLQSRMLAEVFKTEVKKFHDDMTKTEPAFLKEFDIFDLYDKFYKAKYNLLSEKGTVVKDDEYIINNKYGLNDVYSNLALLMLFPGQENFLKIKKQELLALPIARYGIVEIIDGKEIRFIHQTFAEYSVAQFFSATLINNEPREACNYFFTNILLDDNCRVIRYFIDCFLKKNKVENYLTQYEEHIVELCENKTYKNKNNKTILHVAAKEGNLHTLNFLSEILKDKYKETFKSLLEEKYDNQLAWHDAARKGHIKILEVLWEWAKHFKLDHNAMLFEQGKLEETAWIQASVNLHFDVLEKIWNWTEEITLNHTSKTNLLVSKDSNYKRNAFHYAAANKNIKALQTLKFWATENQLDCKNEFLLSKDKYEQTSFHLAAADGHVEILKMLRDWATETECGIINELLLSKNNNECTPFHLAAMDSHVEVLKMLRDWAKETDCDFKNNFLLSKSKHGQSVFHLAATEGHVEVLRMLRNWATETDCDFKNEFLLSKNINGHTAFHVGALKGHVEVLKMLRYWITKTDSDFKNEFLLCKDKCQQTVFNLAVRAGHVKVLKLFRDWATETGCDFKNDLLLLIDINGETAFDQATFTGNIEVLEMLRNWATEIDCDFKNEMLLFKNTNEKTPFHLAAKEGQVEVLKVFREWATNTNCDFKNEMLLFKNKFEQSAFNLAAKEGHIEVLKILQYWATETNCDFKNELLLPRNINKHTAFHLAATEGQVEVLKLLRDWATETDCDFKNELLLSTDKCEQSAFHLAAIKGHVEVLKLLRDWARETECNFKKDLLLFKNINRDTVFHLATTEGHVEVLKILREWATETECDFKNEFLLFKDNYNQTPFHIAARAGHVEVLKVFRDWATKTECDIKNDLLLSKDAFEQCTFNVAAMKGHVKVLIMLRDWALESDCDFKNELLLSKNNNGDMAFHLAVRESHVEVLKILRDWATETVCDFKNEFLLSKNIIGDNAFHVAATVGHVGVLKTLRNWATETDCDFKNEFLLSKNFNGHTAFHVGVLKGHVEVFKKLRDWILVTDCDFKNEFLLSKDKCQQFAFNLAVMSGHVKVLKMLRDWATETGCDFKNDLLLPKDINGWTAFDQATFTGNIEVLKILRDWATETDCDFKNELLLSKSTNKNTPFHLAAMKGHVEVLKMLRDWALESDCDFKNELLLSKNNNIDMAFHLAAMAGHVEVLKILRDWLTKTDCDFKNEFLLSKNNYGCTLFHLVAMKGHVEVLKMLRNWAMETDCDFKNEFLLSKNIIGDTSFHLVATAGHVEVLKLLLDWAAEIKCNFTKELLASKNFVGDNAFQQAAMKGHVEVLKMFQYWASERKRDLKNELLASKNFIGNNAFHLAAKEGHIDALKMLRNWAMETDFDFKNKFLLSKNLIGNTLFHLAATEGHVEVLRMLRYWARKSKCDFKYELLLSKNIIGDKAFHLAATKGHIEVLKILRHWATETECDIKIEFLLSKNIDRHSVFHLAKMNNHVEVLNMLLEWFLET